MRASLSQTSGVWKSRMRVLLRPGLGLKRWLALLAVSAILFSVGIGFAMAIPISPKVLPVLSTLTLSGYSPVVRGGIFILAGTALAGMATYQTYKWFLVGTSYKHGMLGILTAMDTKQRRDHGPRIVAIGGGTGVSTLLQGLKRHTGNLTAIVTIADDGGSSGRLRDELHMPPPGDARNCLIALSESGPLMEEIFDFRFHGDSYLDGHSLGNLFLAAMYQKLGGFQEGLEAAAQLLAVSGRVVAVSNNTNLVLIGETISGRTLRGESAVGLAPEPLRRVWIEPEEAFANKAALEAIHQAELIVIGPGSLYTSIIPNFLVRDIRNAISASHALKVFVCNVATQPHETDGYGAEEHLKVFQAHSGVTVSHVLVNSRVLELPEEWHQVAIPSTHRLEGFEGSVILADVVDEDHPTRHNPLKLGNALMAIGRFSSHA